MILHQVESLAAAGVTDIVLAVNYRPDVMVSALKKVHGTNSIYTIPVYAYLCGGEIVRRAIQRQDRVLR